MCERAWGDCTTNNELSLDQCTSRTKCWYFDCLGVFYLGEHKLSPIMNGPENLSFCVSKRSILIDLFIPASVSLYNIVFIVF